MRKYLPYLRWKILCVSFLLPLIMSTAITDVNAAGLPYLFVYPTSGIISAPGENVTITIKVYNVTNLYGWDFQLTYDDTLLEKVNISVVGTDQVAPPDSAKYTVTDNSIAGKIIFGCAFSGAMSALPFNGSGVLAWITFKGKMEGLSNLSFVESWTFIWDPYGNMISRDPCVDGEIEVIPEFPASIVMPLLLIATLAATFLGKMVWSRKRKDALTA